MYSLIINRIYSPNSARFLQKAVIPVILANQLPNFGNNASIANKGLKGPELTITSEDLFDPISQKASNFINRNIPSLIDQATVDLNPDDDYIIDSIEIDLDRINFENIHELNQSFLSKFRDILFLKLTNAQVDKTFKFEKSEEISREQITILNRS